MMVYDAPFNLFIFTCDSCGKLEEKKDSELPLRWYEFSYRGKTRHLCSKDCAESILSTESQEVSDEFDPAFYTEHCLRCFNEAH